MENLTDEQVKVIALRQYLQDDGQDVTYEDVEILINKGDYVILTDEEADKEAKEYILNSVWAFNYDFLCAHSESIAEMPEKCFTDMQGTLCESFNKAVLAMIDDKEHFVDDAIASDGRGHFLSPYDGEENEVCINGQYLFIYRQN